MIVFTEFFLPHGRQRPMYVNRSMEVEKRAKEIHDAGFRLEAEVLTTGEMSLTISDRDADYDMRICANGPAILEAVDSLIMEFDMKAAFVQKGLLAQKDTPTPPLDERREDIRRDIQEDPGRKDFYDIPDDPNQPLPPSGDPTRH